MGRINQYSSLMQKFYLLLLLLFGCVGFAQLSVFGDVYITGNQALSIHVPATHFHEGVIHTDADQTGTVLFLPENHGLDAHHGSHIAAKISSLNTADFTFPTGDQGVYQPLRIEQGTAGELTAAFEYSGFPGSTSPPGVERVSNRFYWTTQGDKSGRLSLSWNSFSELNSLTDELAALVMLGHTGTEWEVIPAKLAPFALDGASPSSFNQGAISSLDVLNFSRYTAFTLGAVSLATTLNISEGFSPNGDGINDRWYIENIERSPQARIWVYNRWGEEVFYSPGNYNNNWDGTYKNFTTKLPAASYLYRIDQDNNGSIEHEGWIYISY